MRPRAAWLLAVALLVAACDGGRAAPTATTTPSETPSPVAAAPSPGLGRGSAETLPQSVPPPADPVALAERLRGATPTPVTPAPVGGRQAGEQAQFFLLLAEPPSVEPVRAQLRAVSEHAYLYTTTLSGWSDQEARSALDIFESDVYPTVARWWGPPLAGPDGDPHVTILVAPLNGVGGYVTGTDYLPRSIDRYSNERSMLYLESSVRPASRSQWAGLAAHELQHLVHYARNPHADAWFNEGMSEVARSVVQTAGVLPWTPVSLPDVQLNDFSVEQDGETHYAAAAAFLLYALSRLGGLGTVRPLLDQKLPGVDALARPLAERSSGKFDDLFADWLVANVTGELRPSDGARATGPAERSPSLAFGASESGQVHQLGWKTYLISDPRPGETVALSGSPEVQLVPTSAHSGNGFWFSGRGDGMDATLTRSLDLRTVSGPVTLDFWAWYQLEKDWDCAYVEVSDDGGRRRRHLTSAGSPTTTCSGPLAEARHEALARAGGRMSKRADATP